MDRAEREAKLQAALVAVSDSMVHVGYGWLSQRGTVTIRGVLRMTILVEPVWAPITVSTLVLALAKHKIRPRTVRPRPKIDLRARHAPTGVELDFMIAAKLSAGTRRALEGSLGKGWRKRGPVR